MRNYMIVIYKTITVCGSAVRVKCLQAWFIGGGRGQYCYCTFLASHSCTPSLYATKRPTGNDFMF
jgi:hypothetical protein